MQLAKLLSSAVLRLSREACDDAKDPMALICWVLHVAAMIRIVRIVVAVWLIVVPNHAKPES